MYDGFSDKDAHSVAWFEIMKNFLKLAFVGDHREVRCPCNRCRNRKMLFEYEMSGHIAKYGFMLNYLLWHRHGEMQTPTTAKPNESDDEDQMDDMIAHIGMEYDLAFSNEKVHDGTDLIVLQVVTCLMAMKSNYNFSN
jgi:hypothetical protein